jgi:hypothetical protein
MADDAGSPNPVKRFGGIRELERRLKGRSAVLEQSKDAIAAELLAMGFANLTDVVTWDAAGNVSIIASDQISETATRAIKKVKSTVKYDKEGGRTETLEIELHDKVRILQVLAKACGLMDESEKDLDAPSVVGIKMVGPDVIETEYEEITAGDK